MLCYTRAVADSSLTMLLQTAWRNLIIPHYVLGLRWVVNGLRVRRAPAFSNSLPPSTIFYPATGTFKDATLALLTGGSCNVALFGDFYALRGLDCSIGGFAVTPKSTCSGQTCTLTSTTPKLVSRLDELYAVQIASSLICDGRLHGLAATAYVSCLSIALSGCTLSDRPAAVPGPCQIYSCRIPNVRKVAESKFHLSSPFRAMYLGLIGSKLLQFRTT